MKEIFSCKKYVADVKRLGDSPRDWAKQCKGREIIDGLCTGEDGTKFYIPKEWREVQFEVGDRVRAINKLPYEGMFGVVDTLGKVGTVIEVGEDDTCAIEFDEHINGHDRNGKGKMGHCWWIAHEKLELVKAPQVIFDGEKTTLIKDGKKYVAKCNDGDTYDREKGLLVCLAKANGITYQEICEMLKNAETKEKPAEAPKKGVKEVKRKAKVGEYIKIAGDSVASCGCYESGDILKVYKRDFAGVYCDLKKKLDKKRIVNDSGNIIIFHHEYVVLENYKPYKITLSEFWAQKGKKRLAIHCKTEEEAKKLLKAFARVGQKWYDGNSYLWFLNWEYYNKNTVYWNNGLYSSITEAKGKQVVIYEFDEIDLDN